MIKNSALFVSSLQQDKFNFTFSAETYAFLNPTHVWKLRNSPPLTCDMAQVFNTATVSIRVYDSRLAGQRLV